MTKATGETRGTSIPSQLVEKAFGYRGEVALKRLEGKLIEMEQVVMSRQMRALEWNSEYLGVSRLQLMENAGKGVAREIALKFKPKDNEVMILAGLGGKGGDGCVAARHLACMEFKVSVVLVGRPEDIETQETKWNWETAQLMRSTVTTSSAQDSSSLPEIHSSIVIDALLGIGVRGRVRPPILQAIDRINASRGFKVSIDLPTGIDPDTGEVQGSAVKSNLTITLHRAKPGLARAREYVGELTVIDIGIPPEAEIFSGPGDALLTQKPRPRESKKGDFGSLLVIGGSETYSGAPALVALAALRTGVDLTFIAAPEKTAHVISSMSPSLITLKLSGEHLNTRNLREIAPALGRATSVVIGPGLGLHEESAKTVDKILILAEKAKMPILIDADALKAFARFKRRLKTPAVLTPHAGEYRTLTGENPPDDLNTRIDHVMRSAQELGAVILLKARALKGSVDIISDGRRVKLNSTGNPGMTVGGTGDTLSGIVGALLAQRADPFEAASTGAFLNGAAGDFAASEKGYHLIPSDLIDWIPKVMDDPMSHLKVRRP